MRRNLMWILLIGLGIGGAVLVARHDQTTFGMSSDDLGDLLVKIALLVFVGSSVLVMFRHSFSQALQAALLWVVVGLVLVVAYTYRFELRNVGDRIMAELVPGRAATRANVVEIARGRSGSFGVSAQVNGANVPMILDTGASAVVLTQDAAKAAGLPLEVLNYNVTVDTANGRTRAASVTLDKIAVGGVIERQVPALIAQPGQLRTSLLGMTFLNRLESWEVRGDKLVMRGYP